jgi:hypothetical protein
MENLFYKLYDTILTEALEIPRHVFKELEDYIVEIAKKIGINDIKRLTQKSAPPKEFKIDFTGTRWEFLNVMNPRIKMYLSMGRNNTYYSNRDPVGDDKDTIRSGKGYMMIDYTDGLQRIISELLEHELAHFVQYSIQANENRKREGGSSGDRFANKKKPLIGGLPNARHLPKDLTVGGRKIKSGKTWQLHKFGNRVPFPTINGIRSWVLNAPDHNTAVRKAKGYMGDKWTKDHKMVAQDQNHISNKRVEHTHRPIEYYTDMLSLIRVLQYNYHQEQIVGLESYTKKEYFQKFMSGQHDAFASRKQMDMAYRVFKIFKSLPKPLYQQVLKRVYNIFVNKDVKKDFDEIKKILKDTEEAIVKGKADVKGKRVVKPIPFDLKVEDFKAPPLIETIYDLILTDLDDGNYDGSREILSQLGIHEKWSEREGEDVYSIPMNWPKINKLFTKLDKMIKEAKTTNEKSDYYKGDDRVPWSILYEKAAVELFSLIHYHLDYETGKRLPKKLLFHWIEPNEYMTNLLDEKIKDPVPIPIKPKAVAKKIG